MSKIVVGKTLRGPSLLRARVGQGGKICRGDPGKRSPMGDEGPTMTHIKRHDPFTPAGHKVRREFRTCVLKAERTEAGRT